MLILCRRITNKHQAAPGFLFRSRLCSYRLNENSTCTQQHKNDSTRQPLLTTTRSLKWWRRMRQTFLGGETRLAHFQGKPIEILPIKNGSFFLANAWGFCIVRRSSWCTWQVGNHVPHHRVSPPFAQFVDVVILFTEKFRRQTKQHISRYRMCGKRSYLIENTTLDRQTHQS